MKVGRSQIGKSFIDTGGEVICDSCDIDYTDSEELGGGLRDGLALCEECLETEYQNGGTPDLLCPEGMTFKNFVLIIRALSNLTGLRDLIIRELFGSKLEFGSQGKREDGDTEGKLQDGSPSNQASEKVEEAEK